MPRTKPSAVKFTKAAKVPAKGAKRPPKKSFTLQRGGLKSYQYAAQPPLNDQTVAVTALTVRVALPALPDGSWGGQVYANMALFPRAAAMAKLFQEYRITRLDYLLQPNSNIAGVTVVTAPPTGNPVPYASASMPYLQGLKWLNAPKIASDVTDLFMSEVGVTPIMFERECVITQKPIVNYNIANSVSATAAPTTSLAVKQSPWIATTTAAALADSTTHWGPIVRIVQQPSNAVDPTAPTTITSPGWYQVRCTFEFRKPSQYKAAA